LPRKADTTDHLIPETSLIKSTSINKTWQYRRSQYAQNKNDRDQFDHGHSFYSLPQRYFEGHDYHMG